MTQNLHLSSFKVNSGPCTIAEVDQRVCNSLFLLGNASNMFTKHAQHSVGMSPQAVGMERLLKDLLMCLGRLSAKTMTPGLENNLRRPSLPQISWTN